MDITTRSLWTLFHGMGFGMLYLLACSGALLELRRFLRPGTPAIDDDDSSQRFLRIYLVAMVLLAWLAVLTGPYVVYPWYRASATAGATYLTAYPQLLLKVSPSTIGWHSFGMEWKEHIAWLTPISITMATCVFFQYGRQLREHPALRTAVLTVTAISFFAAAVAGFFGAMINKFAPIAGGSVLHLRFGA